MKKILIITVLLASASFVSYLYVSPWAHVAKADVTDSPECGCSAPGLTTQDECENDGQCAPDDTYNNETDCEDNGRCSGGGYMDPTSCENAGYCDDNVSTDENTCTSNGYCIGGTGGDPASCTSGGSQSQEGTVRNPFGLLSRRYLLFAGHGRFHAGRLGEKRSADHLRTLSR